MTKKEFASEIRIREKQFNRALFIGMTAVGIWMLSAPFLDHFYNFNESKSAGQAWAGVGAVVIVLVFVVLLVYGGKRGVPCRRCKKHLFGIPGQIAVAAEYCGYCGEKAFE